ncbi:GGDEF domain-containing protein [Psychrosphaera aquimarina]|uniref:diguanylate cyclase n=1 Tax=Psychrosphaera aquimarina TaxID=2044854 RepID=A0ABU3R4R5_9GAMM|nr:GGDEF domain-containing protein [Psychrosphaera aquimarina]MDU0114440.1 GGDEF domain-containing protein [Psychrosphaera aquimarina]
MNYLVSNFIKAVSVPVILIFALFLIVQNGMLDLTVWQELLTQTPMLLFIGAIVVALRFKQSRVIYILLFLLLSWALFVEIDHFKYLNFSPSLWFLSQLFILVLFTFDQNKTIWGRHGLIRALIILAVILVNYRFNQSITLHQFLNTEFIADLHLGGMTQIELVLSVLALLMLAVKHILSPSKTVLNTWVIAFFLVYFKLIDAEVLTHLIAFSVFGLLLIQGVLTDSYQMAFSDELTGLSARRALLQSSISLGKKYTIAMLDVDHFKKFNDTYGHDVGDQVLKLVASKINEIKGGGKAYRYGGEEFTIVFPNKSVNYAIPYLEQVRESIAIYAMTIRDNNERPDDSKTGKSQRSKNDTSSKVVNVTISIGVAEREGDLKDFDQVMKQADEALYRAKQAGRNCLAE